MSITYEEALSTLTSMFGSPWTQATLDAVLRHHEGHMENTVESVLSHCDGDPMALVNRLKNPLGPSSGGGVTSEHVDLDEELARQLATEPERPAQQPARPTGLDGTPIPGVTGRSAPTPTSGEGSTQSSGQGPSSSGRKNCGTPTQLPPDFLRIPGPSSDMDGDEKLARMLQDALFTQELRNNPEFAHLAGDGRGQGGGAVPPGGGWGRTNPASGRGRGVGFLPPGLGINLPIFPGRQAAQGGKQQEGPNIVENLKGESSGQAPLLRHITGRQSFISRSKSSLFPTKVFRQNGYSYHSVHEVSSYVNPNFMLP